MKRLLLSCAAALCASMSAAPGFPQAAQAQSESRALTDYSKWSQQALEAELARRAIVEKKVLMPMRDGVHLSTDIYRPKIAPAGGAPIIFVRTPYNMNTLSTGSLRQVVEAIDRGYAYVMQNERGRISRKASSKSSAIRAPTAMTR